MLVHPLLRRFVVMSGGHCTYPTGGPAIRLKNKKLMRARRPKYIYIYFFFVPFLSRLQSFSFIPSFKSILFPLANFPDSRLSVYHYFLASILFFIWQSRNLATFENRILSSRNIVNLIIKDIRTRILGESINRVKEIWSVNNLICSVNRDSIVFHLD